MNKLLFSILLLGLASRFVLAQELDSTDVVIGVFKIPKPVVQTPEEPEAAPVYWKKGGTFNVNLQQVGLKNWAAGGESSFAVGGAIDAHANYEKDEMVWENKVKVGYGVIRNGGNDSGFEKTDDIFDISSKYSQKFSEKILMSMSIHFRTQMDEGYKLEKVSGSDTRRRVFISDFMAPGYLQASMGLTFRDEKAFSTTVAPFTGRFTFVLNDSLSKVGAFGVEPEERIRSEAGISWTGGYQRDVLQNVKLKTNFNFFSNYEKFPNTVVNLEAGLNMKVNSFISSNISSQLIYDDDVILTRDDGTQGRDVQIKNVINVGFTLGF